jgi:hypothetical protein
MAMSNDLNPKFFRMVRWFLVLTGLLWLVVAVAAWSTSATLSVCVGGVGVALLLLSIFGSGYVAATIRYFTEKNP